MQIVPAVRDDLPFLASLRNEATSVRYSKRGMLTLEQLEEDCFDNPAKRAFIAHHAGRPVGYVMREALDGGCVEIGVALAVEHRGQGLGVALIRAGTAALFEDASVQRVVAIVLAGNEASAHAFERAGYDLEASSAEHARYGTCRPAS